MTVTNKDRAEWAAAALKHFETLTGTDHAGGLAELLCDLMHFADAYTFDFPDALDRARANYDQEFFEETKPTIPETIPYMAYFRTTAGPANDIYQAETPDQALRIAQEIFDRDDESLGFTPGDCPGTSGNPHRHRGRRRSPYLANRRIPSATRSTQTACKPSKSRSK